MTDEEGKQMTERAIVVQPGEGRSVDLRGTTVGFKVGSDHAKGASCLEWTAAPGFDTGAHIHSELEETWYVLEGELEFSAGEETFRAGPGVCVFVPPEVPHSFANRGGGSARFLLILSPADFDHYFDGLAAILAVDGPPDAEAIGALRKKHKTEQLSALSAGPGR